MDTIDTFLDAMFAPYPATERLREARAELRAMMEDAYHDALASGRTHNEAVGRVITDFGNLEELAPVLGIASELRADDAGTGSTAGAARPGPPAADPDYPVVTLPQARALAKARRDTASTLGHAVAAFVLAPAALIALTDLAEHGRIAMGEPEANVIGLALTLATVAAGVVMLVRRRAAFAGVGHLLTGRFTRDPVVSAWASRERQGHEVERSKKLSIAVALWIMAALPLIASGMLASRPGADQGWTGPATALTLVLVAIGLQIYLPASWSSTTHSTLTTQGRPAAEGRGQDGDGGARWEKDKDDPLIGLVASVFWPACVILYLLWSFLWNAWDRSWILWPVAGLAFGAFAGARSSLRARGRPTRQRR
ncbi:permease prefix domain 1-containing protein [Actinomyces bowdenii]|nr:permease prefix domain 1-containing protein [Actinomyces bowdenii]